MLYAEVAVNSTFPHRQTFSYGVPDGMDVGRRPRGLRAVRAADAAGRRRRDRTRRRCSPSRRRSVRSARSSASGRCSMPTASRSRTGSPAYYLAPIFDAVALMLPPGFERKPLTTVYPLVDAGEIDGLDLTRAPARDARRDRRRRARRARRAARAPRVLRRRRRARRSSSGAASSRASTTSRGRASARRRSRSRRSPSRSTTRCARIAAAEPPKHSRRAAVLDRLAAQAQRSPTEEATRLAGSRANLERLVRAAAVRYDREGHNIAARHLAVGGRRRSRAR